jgi:hypothetical protein
MIRILMTRNLIAAFTVALLSGSLLAQSPQPPSSESSPQEQQTPSAQQPATTPAQDAPAASASDARINKIAPGSVLPVQLTRGINAKKAKTGDEVVATVTQDMRNNAGTVIVPKDTKVVGHVTEAQPRSKEQKESEVGIAFDHAVLKTGEMMQMPMSIQAIIAPPSRNSDSAANGNSNAQQPSSYPGGAQAGGASAPGGGRGSMGGAAPTASAPQTSGNSQAETPTGGKAQPQITGNTQGVVGIADLNLSSASDATQGSVVKSEKNNVKLDDGTFLLLRVNQ